MKDRHSTIKSNSGVAMIVVLCIMALMLALCLSLLYGASQISANAQKRMNQVQTYQFAETMSRAFAEELADESKNSNASSLNAAVQRFLRNDSGIFYQSAVQYTLTLDEAALPAGCDEITITLIKSAFDIPITYNGAKTWENSDVTVGGYNGEFNLTVRVTYRGVDASVTTHYSCAPKNDSKVSENSNLYSYYYFDVNENLIPLTLHEVNGDVLFQISNNHYLMNYGRPAQNITLEDALDSDGVINNGPTIYRMYSEIPIYEVTCEGEI